METDYMGAGCMPGAQNTPCYIHMYNKKRSYILTPGCNARELVVCARVMHPSRRVASEASPGKLAKFAGK